MSRLPLKDDQNTVIVAFRIAEDDKEEFDKLCQKLQRDKSEVLRAILGKWVRQVKAVGRARN